MMLKISNKIVIFSLFLIITSIVTAQDSLPKNNDTLVYSGLFSGWMLYNFSGGIPLWMGGRYLPAVNYTLNFGGEKKIDFEASINASGYVGCKLFDSIEENGSLNAYRAWIRYSASQFEVRLGLQKINFGSANILRPLMWFDQIDARDPLQITDGVWAFLTRYYFLNNANIWFWGLYGNNHTRTWDVGQTKENTPEFGVRFQHPVPKGELALTFHHRNVDIESLPPLNLSYNSVQENRFAFDGRFDFNIGLWFEFVWINKTKNTDNFTNQEIMCLGADYTIGLGNGFHTIVEHLVFSTDNKPFNFENQTDFTGISITYPLGIADNISAIVFHQWRNNSTYNFIRWNHQFRYFSLYIMMFWNPVDYNMPALNDSGKLFAGKGIQLMFAYNH